MTRNFLTMEEVIAIHDDLISEFGGAMGLRDLGALESALIRPQMGYYDGLIAETAALRDCRPDGEPGREPSLYRWEQAHRPWRH